MIYKKQVIKIIMMLSILSFLSISFLGCGLKGDLYLPTDPEANNNSYGSSSNIANK